MIDPVKRKGMRILREQEAKLYMMHLMLHMRTGVDALTPEEWKALSFKEKAIAAGKSVGDRPIE
jgi:hypothetical protein